MGHNFYEVKYPKPIRVYLSDVGYNYVIGYGKLLSEEWFMRASEFNDLGFAIVQNYDRRKYKIDLNGNLEEIN